MTERKRKVLYWLFRILGIVVSCALPIIAILVKFPIWKESQGTGRTIGIGAILIGFVLLVIFRSTVFSFIAEKLDIKHAPPLVVWPILLLISYILIFIGNVIADMTTVFWMGFIGCAIGTLLTWLSDKYADKKEVKEDE